MKRMALVGVILLFTFAVKASAGPFPPPVLDFGWTYDQVNSKLTDSEDSPYVYSLVAPAYFRITDYFLPGDTYNVYDNGSLVLTTVFDGAHASLFPIGDPFGDQGWTNMPNNPQNGGDYSHGELLLDIGIHSLTVQGNIETGVLPAGFYARIDSAPIPEPASLVLLGIGLGALGLVARRRK